MGTKDLPVSNAQSLQNGLADLPAKHRVCIHGSHENRRVLIVFRLLRGKTMNIDVYISGESNAVLIIDQNDLTGQMSALSFKDLKEQVAELKKSDLGQRSLQGK